MCNVILENLLGKQIAHCNSSWKIHVYKHEFRTFWWLEEHSNSGNVPLERFLFCFSYIFMLFPQEQEKEEKRKEKKKERCWLPHVILYYHDFQNGINHFSHIKDRQWFHSFPVQFRNVSCELSIVQSWFSYHSLSFMDLVCQERSLIE